MSLQIIHLQLNFVWNTSHSKPYEFFRCLMQSSFSFSNSGNPWKAFNLNIGENGGGLVMSPFGSMSQNTKQSEDCTRRFDAKIKFSLLLFDNKKIMFTSGVYIEILKVSHFLLIHRLNFVNQACSNNMLLSLTI